MAKFAATDVYVLLNSQNISDWCFSVDAPDAKNQIDVSGFNSTSSKEFVAPTKAKSRRYSMRWRSVSALSPSARKPSLRLSSPCTAKSNF